MTKPAAKSKAHMERGAKRSRVPGKAYHKGQKPRIGPRLSDEDRALVAAFDERIANRPALVRPPRREYDETQGDAERALRQDRKRGAYGTVRTGYGGTRDDGDAMGAPLVEAFDPFPESDRLAPMYIARKRKARP